MSNINTTTKVVPNFNLNALSANAIIKEPKTKKADETILQKYQRITIEKLEKSLLEAKGRYGVGVEAHAYKDPKPSQNWRVVTNTKNEPILHNGEEQVAVWLKVGISKVGLNEKGDKEVVIPASVLPSALEEMIKLVKSATKDDDFHKQARLEAKPKTKPREDKHPGCNAWKYDSKSDSYVAFFDEAVAKAEAEAEKATAKLKAVS